MSVGTTCVIASRFLLLVLLLRPQSLLPFFFCPLHLGLLQISSTNFNQHSFGQRGGEREKRESVGIERRLSFHQC